MTTVDKIKCTKEKVIALLKEQDNYKNNDEALVVRYWWDELPDNMKNTMKAVDFLKMYRDGMLTTADVITRARRKAQEDDETLQGHVWKERARKEAERKVRKEINKP